MSNTCARSYEWLAELAFTSDRKRMSVVVRDADNVLWLYSKGADNVMLPRLAPNQSILDDTVAHCERFAATGLRYANLLVASSTLFCFFSSASHRLCLER
jgi:magnesium-transporting ATPase (P-type)